MSNFMFLLQVYLVGDPVQLPATVISSTALEQGYDVSMFKRLQASGYPVNVLDVQYRMHPAISLFPSQEFYQGRLKDGEVWRCCSMLRAGVHTTMDSLHAPRCVIDFVLVHAGQDAHAPWQF
jgi:hypothetical protein